MLKVMRKYNKMILVVGGSLLMVAFLMPQAIGQIGKRQQGRSIGTMDGHKITAAEYDMAVRELRALDEFFQMSGGAFPIALDEDSRTEHWLLLAAEAEQAGLVGGGDEGATLLPILATEFTYSHYRRLLGPSANAVLQQNPDLIQQAIAQKNTDLLVARNRAAGTTRLTPHQFDEGLARFRGVFRLVRTYLDAERISDRQAAAIASKLADSVLVDAVFLDARDLADESLTPTPEDLQAHFERFRDLRLGEGDYGIGYRLPPRLKVEWIELNRPAISEAVVPSLVDANKLWQQNRDRFPGLFPAERDAVEAELRNAEVDRVMRTAETVIRSAILMAVRPLEKDGVYKVLPSNWAQLKPDFIKLAEQIVTAVREQHGIKIPLPAVHVRNAGWYDLAMLGELPGIGAASVRFERQQAPFSNMVMSVRELAGDLIFGVQIGVPPADLVAQDSVGSRFYFTVLGAAAESTPATIDELLAPEKLAQDWRALKQYEGFTASAEQSTAAVIADGIEAFATSFGKREMLDIPVLPEGFELPEPADRVAVQKNGRVTERGTRGLFGLDASIEVIEGVRDMARTIDPMTPIDEIGLGDRVVVIPVPGRLGVLVAQINGVEPLTRETLPAFADHARNVLKQDRFQDVNMPYPFMFQVLSQRHAFTLKTSKDDETDQTIPAEDEPEVEAEEGEPDPAG